MPSSRPKLVFYCRQAQRLGHPYLPSARYINHSARALGHPGLTIPRQQGRVLELSDLGGYYGPCPCYTIVEIYHAIIRFQRNQMKH
jgi:hypothetical protein